jgi:hypothetical protein
MLLNRDPLRWKSVIGSLAISLLATPSLAKRVPPKPVTPVVSGGIKYSVAGDGRDQYVVAEGVSDGKELWKIRIFHNQIKFWIEEDVQWVFITDLKLVDSSLVVRDERSRCYSVNLVKKDVQKRRCAGVF